MSGTRRNGGEDGATVPGGTAFVLSGGGNLGALQVGMLRALLEHDVVADLVLGCSVGAINGAGFADDPSLEGIGRLESLWKALDGQNMLPSGWLPNAVSLARKGEAIHDHDALRRMAEDSLSVQAFEELRVPFQCVATDIMGVRETWFSSGPIVEAILASSALPAIYPAVEIDGVRYLDGGIVDDVPMSRAVELGATTIYVLQVGGFTRPRPEPRRPLDVAVQAYWIARHHRFKRDLAAMPEGIEVHVLPAGETPRMRFNDFTHSGTLMTLAHAATGAYLDDRTAGLPIPPLSEALAAPGVVGEPEPDGEERPGESPGGHGSPVPTPPSDRGDRDRAHAGGRGAGGDRDRARAGRRGDGGDRRDGADRDDGADRRDLGGDDLADGHGLAGARLGSLSAVSGLGAAHAVGARVARLPRVAKLLSRGDDDD